MSVDDAIKRLKTESRSIIEAREQQEKAREITAGRKNIVAFVRGIVCC